MIFTSNNDIMKSIFAKISNRKIKTIDIKICGIINNFSNHKI